MLINEKVIDNINTNYITVDELVFMYSTYYDFKWNINISPSSINKLKRMNIIDANNSLTANGELVLFYCVEEVPKQKLDESDSFQEIWEIFPRDDGYRHFPKTRMIRWNKNETQKYYNEALQETTHKQLVQALKNEIKFRSDSTTENLFKYMKGSINWFKTKAYLDFLEQETELEDIHGKSIC